jgi:hypothetical protein
MKNLKSILLVAITIVSLISCSKDSTTSTSGTTTGDPTEPVELKTLTYNVKVIGTLTVHPTITYANTDGEFITEQLTIGTPWTKTIDAKIGTPIFLKIKNVEMHENVYSDVTYSYATNTGLVSDHGGFQFTDPSIKEYSIYDLTIQ